MFSNHRKVPGSAVLPEFAQLIRKTISAAPVFPYCLPRPVFNGIPRVRSPIHAALRKLQRATHLVGWGVGSWTPARSPCFGLPTFLRSQDCSNF